jgi:hypothetical protein
MAMAFMFVLVTIVIAMHTTQARAVRNVTQAEAELQFRQSSEFAAAELFSQAQTPPDFLKVTAEPDLVGDLDMAANYGSKLYTGLPDWNPKDQEFAPGHRTYKIEPHTNDQALNVFAGKAQWLVAHDHGGYAVYAPNGTVKLEQGVGWANPVFADERPSADAYSGVPFLVAAKGSIEVAKLPYGNAYSVDGPIDLGDDKTDLATAFKGPLPMRSYEQALKKSLQEARSKLEGDAASGNKTNDIKGSAVDGVINTLSMLTSGDPSKLTVSLEQAMSFPFPTIPSFSATVPGVFFEFWFHVPFPPDFADAGSSDASQGEKNGQAVDKLQKEIKALEDEINQLKAQLAAASDDDEREEIQAKIDDKQSDLDDKKDEWESIQEQIKDNSGTLTSEVQGKINGPAGAPDTRNDDKSIPNTGMKGWNYSKLMGNMLSLLWDTATGDPEGIAEDLKADVRLVHFGGPDNIPDFRFNDGFYAKSTWTVPPGRSFKFDGKMTVAGDLWLQKGSVMQVTGDLVLENPDPSGSNALKPSGKLVLEQGATLIVGGDLRCAGDPRFGSIWTCSPPTHLAPVTSAIFVTGSATIPYGSFSATNLEDAARALDSSSALADSLSSFFNDIAPNMSKIAGAFHERQPYFASYATTFQLTIIPPTIFNPPIPVPTPIPLPKENLLVPLFRTMTTVFTGAMNASLGENTYTHADWWGFGEGVVPAMIKLDPTGPMNALKSINLSNLQPDLDWDDYLDDLVDTALKGAAEFAVKTVGRKIITSVIGSVAPGGSIINEVLNQLLSTIDTKESTFEAFQEKVTKAAVDPIVKEFEKFKDKVQDEIENGLKEVYMREVGGPLIYARSISVGDAADPPLLMSGMLVADETLSVQTQSFVGSLTSFEGNISAGKVYFTPVFTRASLYEPKATSTASLTRVAEFKYGKNFDSNQSIDVGTGVWQVTTEGWSR